MRFIAALLAVFLCSPAYAQTICIDRIDLLDRLAAEFEEYLVEVRMIEDQGLLEFTRSPTKGTWTVILTKPSGTSCLIASGEGLTIAPAKKELVSL